MVQFSRVLEHKRVMNDLATLVTADALGAMAVARSDSLGKVASSLRASAPVILDQYGRISGTLSSQYYMDVRKSAGVKSKYSPTIATLDVAQSTDDVVGYTVSRIASGTPFDTAASIFSGGLGRSVLGVDRMTVMNNAVDEGSQYRRVASASGCAFCLYAAVVADVVTESFDGFHDHCQCTTVPLFDTRLDNEPDYYDEFRTSAADARQAIIDYRASIEDQWRAEWKAAGGRMGKNLNRDFLRAHPEAAITSKNVIARIRAGV